MAERITSNEQQYRWAALIVATITLLGLAIRLYGLTSYGVWFDEAYHVQLVKLPTVGAMLDAALSNPPSDPLYLLLLRGWSGICGTGDTAIRLLSVIFSTATIPGTYLLGKLVSGRMAGMLAALFLAVSPYALEFGQEAALYALASLTTTLALAAAWHWRNTGREGVLYIALGIVAIYSHYVIAVILLLVALCLLHAATGPSAVRRKNWLVANAIIFVAWTPWLGALALHWATLPGVPRATLNHTATINEVGGAIVQFTSGSASLLVSRYWLWGAGLIAGAALALAGWLAGASRSRRGVRVIFVVAALIFILPAIVSALTGRWLFVPHFMLFLLPAIFVAMSSGVYMVKLDQARAWQRPAPVLLLSTILVWLAAQAWGIVLFNRNPPHGVDGLRDLAAYVQAKSETNDTLFTAPAILTPSLKQYYVKAVRGLPDDFDLRRVYPPYDPEDWHSRSLAAVQPIAERGGKFWLVYRPELDGGRLLQALRSRYKVLDQQNYPFAQLYLFSR